MFRFHSFYKLLDMICTESDIIPHLQDKTTLREERNSSWVRTSQPVDKAKDAKTFQNQFRMEVAAIIFECKTLKRIKFYKAGNLVVSEWRIHSPTLHCTDYPHSDYHSRDYNRLKIHKA